MKSSCMRAAMLAALLGVSVGAVAQAATPQPAEFPPDAFPSTYQPLPAQTTLIRHATIYTERKRCQGKGVRDNFCS